MNRWFSFIVMLVCVISSGVGCRAEESVQAEPTEQVGQVQPEPAPAAEQSAPAKTDEQASQEVATIVLETMKKEIGGGPYGVTRALRVRLREYVDANKDNVGGAWGLFQMAGTCDYEPAERLAILEEFLKLYPDHQFTENVKLQVAELKAELAGTDKPGEQPAEQATPPRAPNEENKCPPAEAESSLGPRSKVR